MIYVIAEMPENNHVRYENTTQRVFFVNYFWRLGVTVGQNGRFRGYGCIF